MKKAWIASAAPFYIMIMLGMMAYGFLFVDNCKSLYYRSLRALKVRNKCRLCVDVLQTLNNETPTSESDDNALQKEESPVCMMHAMASEKIDGAVPTCTLKRELDVQQKPARLSGTLLNNAADLKKKSATMKPFAWPLKKGTFWLSSLFGPRKRPNGSDGFHTGIDLAALKGTPVYAPRSGVVVKAYYTSGYGKTIVIQHGKRFKTRYAHLDTINVAPGDWVSKNSIIGRVGDTGFIRKEGKDGSHLHFEVYEYEKRVNPMQFLPELV